MVPLIDDIDLAIELSTIVDDDEDDVVDDFISARVSTEFDDSILDFRVLVLVIKALLKDLDMSFNLTVAVLLS